MPRMLLNGRWFDPVSARSLYEADYEQALIQHADVLFAGYRCVSFKVPVDSEYGRGVPDLALIDLGFRSWYVVEVELDTHPLQAHVETQVRKFANGKYGEPHVQHIHAEAPDLALDALCDMMLGEQPRVLVLVTSNKPDWASSLAQYGAQVGVVEMFRDDLDQAAFRVNGDQPSIHAEELISLCEPNRVLPNALRLRSPAPFHGLDVLELTVDGEVTTWRIHRVADAAFMTPMSRYPFDDRPKGLLKIVRLPNGEYGLVREDKVL